MNDMPPQVQPPQEGSQPETKPAIQEQLKRFFRRTLREHLLLITLALVTFAAVVAGDAVVGVIGDKLKAAWRAYTRPSDATVLAVFPNTTLSEPMIRGLGFTTRANGERIKLRDGAFLERFDEKDNPEATATALRERFRRGDVVLVIGHERSSTVALLNNRLYESDEWKDEGPVPLVLPAVTNPAITTTRPDLGRHILRLPANDKIQVDRLVDFAVRLNPRAACVLVDESNLTYSQYIATEFVAQATDLPIVDSVGVGLYGHGMIPPFMASRTAANGPATPDENRPDLLVFIGMEAPATILVRRVNFDGRWKLGATAPVPGRAPLQLLFTDGVAGDVFQNSVGRTLAQDEFVYMSGPFPLSEAKGARLRQFPNYTPYAAAAKTVAAELVDQTAARGGITRREVLKSLRTWLNDGKEREFDGLRMRFDEKGDNLSGEAHIFEVGPSRVRHASQCPCQPNREHTSAANDE